MGAATIEEADILIKKLQKSIAADTAALTEGVNKMYTALSEYQNDAEWTPNHTWKQSRQDS